MKKSGHAPRVLWQWSFGLLFVVGCGTVQTLADVDPNEHNAISEAPDGAQPDETIDADIQDDASYANTDLQIMETQQPLDVPLWIKNASATPVGHYFVTDSPNDVSFASLRALGFSKRTPNLYVRQADLLQQQNLVPSIMPELPDIDAIAMISISRKSKNEQYIYTALRSLFDHFPSTAQVNVLVGNADTAYLAPQILHAELGLHAAQRVHLVPTPHDVALFFDKEKLGVASRATWNYARALRSYHGEKKLLLLEDDISWHADRIAQVSAWLTDMPVDVMTLYNDRCLHHVAPMQREETELGLHKLPLQRNSDFPTTQAIVFDAKTAHKAGTYLIQRANRESYDYMLGRFFAQSNSTIGYIYPSIVQHEGRITTGLSGPLSVPYSRCVYVESQPPHDDETAQDI